MRFPVWRTLVARLALGALLAVTATQADASSPITKTTVAVADAPALAADLGEQAAAPAVDVNQQPTSRAGDLVIARKSASTSASQVVERVIADLDATYDDHTTVPSAASAGAEMPVEIRITNTGKRTWVAGGDQPVRLGYHWYDADGHTLLGDGATAALPVDVSNGQTTTVTVIVRAPQVDGTYVLAWDLVQEGVGWFSASAVSMKSERVVVGDGVTFYGKGWGHGIGLSQWGAQGWAQGAAGPRLSGEEILAKYSPAPIW